MKHYIKSMTFLLAALAQPASAEIIELALNTQTLVFDTPEMYDGGQIHRNFRNNVQIVNYQDSRSGGERSFDVEHFDSVITGNYSLMRDKLRQEYSISITARWQTPSKTWCQVNRRDIKSRTLPLQVNLSNQQECNATLYVRRSPNSAVPPGEGGPGDDDGSIRKRN